MQFIIFALWYKPCGCLKKMEDKKSFVLKEEKETKCHCCCCYNNMFHSLSLLLSDLQFIVR